MTLLRINNRILKKNDTILTGSAEPPTPSLPPYTLRLKFVGGETPTFGRGTAVQVSSSPNVWDLTYENSDWSGLVSSYISLLEVIDGNTTNVTRMNSMFAGCSSLTTVPLFDTSSVTSMNGMLAGCSYLMFVPLFNTSNVTDMSGMLYSCVNVQSGALALYNQASTQATPPSNHDRTFYNCGINTTTGAAELAQIPSGWK